MLIRVIITEIGKFRTLNGTFHFLIDNLDTIYDSVFAAGDTGVHQS